MDACTLEARCPIIICACTRGPWDSLLACAQDRTAAAVSAPAVQLPPLLAPAGAVPAGRDARSSTEPMAEAAPPASALVRLQADPAGAAFLQREDTSPVVPSGAGQLALHAVINQGMDCIHVSATCSTCQPPALDRHRHPHPRSLPPCQRAAGRRRAGRPPARARPPAWRRAGSRRCTTLSWRPRAGARARRAPTPRCGWPPRRPWWPRTRSSGAPRAPCPPPLRRAQPGRDRY